MTYGIETRRADQSINMSGASAGGVFIEVLTLAAGTSSSKSYPRVSGNSLYFYVLTAGNHAISLDANSSGQGRITWTAGSGDAAPTVLAMFTKYVNNDDLYGINVFNDYGEVIIDSQYPVPQYLGKTALYPVPPPVRPQQISNSETAWWFTTNISGLGSTDKNRIVMYSLPDSATEEVWYSGTAFVPAGAEYIEAIIIAPSSAFTGSSYSLKVPYAYVYALDKPPSPSGSYGLQVFNPSGSIVYNSTSENLSVAAQLNVYLPNTGSTAAYAIPGGLNYPAITLPDYYTTGVTDVATGLKDTFRAFIKRIGSQIVYKLFKIGSTTASTPIGQFGVKDNLFTAVVDVSNIGYSTGLVDPSGETTLSAPTITSQPASISKREGQTATFSVTATGTGTLTYKWYKNSSVISGATSSSYSFTVGATDMTNDKYKCAVSNEVGTTVSTEGVLTVDHTQPASNASLAINGGTTFKTAGSTVTFTGTASGTPSPTVKIYKDGVQVATGTGTATYSFTMTAAYDGTVWKTIATNSYADGTVATSESSSVTLRLASAPVINTQPTNQTASEGGTATFSVGYTATTPGWTQQWYKNNVLISGATGLSYTTPTLSLSDNGNVYKCIVTNEYGSTTSNTATLTVNQNPVAPTITSNLPSISSVVQMQGSTYSLSISANGYPAPTFQWYKNGSVISGATSNSYSIGSITTSNNGTYFCRVTNSQGSTDSNTSVLTVRTPLSATMSNNLRRAVGDSVGYIVTVTGSNGPVSVVWTCDADDGSYGGIGSISHFTNNGSGSLSFTMVASGIGSAGDYIASISYDDLYTESLITRAAVLTQANPPVISSQPSDITVYKNQSATLSVTASPVTGYQWYKNGVAVSGATGSTYSPSTSTTGTQNIYCLLNNGIDYVSSNSATVTVLDSLPVISSQPSNVTVNQGVAASFSVTASPATSYQWYRDGEAITGATSSSVSANTSNTGTFTYFCRVFNGSSSIDSSSATLTVNTAALTYPSYNNIDSAVVEETDNVAVFGVYKDGTTDNNNWANGTGDGSLYDVRATPVSGTYFGASGYYGINTWYSLAPGGVQWGLQPKATSGFRSVTLNIQVRLRSSGAIVSSGNITLETTTS